LPFFADVPALVLAVLDIAAFFTVFTVVTAVVVLAVFGIVYGISGAVAAVFTLVVTASVAVVFAAVVFGNSNTTGTAVVAALAFAAKVVADIAVDVADATTAVVVTSGTDTGSGSTAVSGFLNSVSDVSKGSAVLTRAGGAECIIGTVVSSVVTETYSCADAVHPQSMQGTKASTPILLITFNLFNYLYTKFVKLNQ
jgi:hypothetical protein